jgi:hypothetical protein
MQDQTDTQTVDMFASAKRGPGRPETGKAMSNAERQKAYRQRKAAGSVQSLPSVSEILATSELDELRAQLEAARWEADFLRAELDEARRALAERVRQESNNRNVTEILPAYHDDLALLLAQYCNSDGSGLAFPAGSASAQEIVESWSRLHAAFHAVRKSKKRNVTKIPV